MDAKITKISVKAENTLIDLTLFTPENNSNIQCEQNHTRGIYEQWNCHCCKDKVLVEPWWITNITETPAWVNCSNIVSRQNGSENDDLPTYTVIRS